MMQQPRVVGSRPAGPTAGVLLGLVAGTLVFAAWVNDRNANHTKSNWHFTTPDARIKLKHLYPSF